MPNLNLLALGLYSLLKRRTFMSLNRYTRLLIIALLLAPLFGSAQQDPRRSNQSLKRQKTSARFESTPAENQREALDVAPVTGTYDEQADYWANVTKQGSASADAWLNYYQTTRFSEYTTTSKVISNKTQRTLDGIVEDMEEAIPNSFEYHYVKYWNGYYDPANYPHLEKALALQPNNVELYDDLIAHYEIVGDSKRKADFSRRWYNSNQVPQGVLAYNRNVLKGLAPNAILITNGEYDTYPIWLLQTAEGLRPDVSVLNVDLLDQESYRERRCKELGLAIGKDYDKNDPRDFLHGLAKGNPDRPVYFGLTTNPRVLKYLQHRLFLTGLAFRYSELPIDNVGELQTNWESNFDTKYLSAPESHATVNRLNVNYVMPALILHRHYLNQGSTEKASELKALVEELAKRGGKSDDVAGYLNN